MIKFNIAGQEFTGMIIDVGESTDDVDNLVFRVLSEDKCVDKHRDKDSGELWVSQTEILIDRTKPRREI